jgi:hypothetical protein
MKWSCATGAVELGDRSTSPAGCELGADRNDDSDARQNGDGSGAHQPKVQATFWDMHRFDADGRIVETWNLMDSLAILQQLGLVPAQPK